MNSFPEWAAWVIIGLPLAASILVALGVRRLPLVSGYLTTLLVFVAFLFSLWALKVVNDQHGAIIGYGAHQWLKFPGFQFDASVRIDGLTAVMLVVVTSVSTLVHFYSQGYMEGDPGYGRYYCYLSLFTASMLGLVLASNILQIFVFWELVGLCSFLLIGFWFHKPTAAAAAKKAFLTTRVGDVGFMIGILIIWNRSNPHTFDIATIQQIAASGAIGSTALTLFALGVFAGAAGKSAQVPLHVWLPDAMEGPTPVSALIHAATMVAAGVYLVARFFPVFAASSGALHTVAWIGGITAIVAATMGIVNPDIKKVLAYSTISQLGYMMLSLGSGAYVAAIFHLMNHAFFKALLFLGSGSVNHASNTFDMRRMGGLRKVMPVTFITFLIGSLSLSGVPPFSGFYSKDDILHAAWNDNKILFVLGFLVVFMTAFYMFRAIFLTFFGEFRGGVPHHDHWTEGWELIPAGAMVAGGHDVEHETHGVATVHAAEAHGGTTEAEASMGAEAHGEVAERESHRAPEAGSPLAHDVPHGGHDEPVHPHESPWVMTLPLLILAVPSIISWLVEWRTGWFGDLLRHALPNAAIDRTPDTINWPLAVASIAMALAGIGAAYVIYQARPSLAETMGKIFRPLYILFSHKWFADDIAEGPISFDLVYRGLAFACAAFDTYVVDGIANGIAMAGREGGAVLRRAQNGEFGAYGFVFGAGVAVVAVALIAAGH
jgi:proton-translocating NADH-quinone oxidoreductase chain L